MSRQLFSAFGEGDSTAFPGNVCQCSVSLTVKKAFLDVQTEPPVLHFVLVASGPVTVQH